MIPAAQPQYFGPRERALFGWLHRPNKGTARRIGVVLCSPSGYEAICTHRAYRHFAEEAAKLGFPALRFDYDGTGNSAGHTLDPDRVAAWIRSIHCAIDTLKELAGVDAVCLFGVRVGVSLASVAAQQRRDVCALIAFAPVVKVKAYLRELRALALARPQAAPPADVVLDPTLQEAAGFATSEQTRNDLSRIDLLQLPSAPAAHVLILDRDDLPADGSWSGHLTAQGASVRQKRLDRYVDMMRDAHQSVVPFGSIEIALQWLSTLQEPSSSHSSSASAGPAAVASSAEFSTPSTVHMRETALLVGGPHPLFGIVSEPATPSSTVSNSSRHVLIILNSGTIHHIGPGRLYVTVARRCAARGMTVLRLDLSGIGESPPRAGESENKPYSASAEHDIAQAVRFVADRYPDAHVHLVGVCSGAYHGLKAAVRGLPLRSVVVINPLTFFWKEGMSLEYADFQVTAEASRYRRSALELSAWFKLLRGKVNLRLLFNVLTRRLSTIATNGMRELARMLRIDLREDLAAELRRVAQRSVDMFFVFSASDPGLAMLHEQGGRTVGQLSRRQALRIAVIHGADHTFTAQWNRDELTEVLLEHLDRYVNAPDSARRRV